MIRFLHGADFHLDSAFGALPPGQAAARESRELALRLADYVKEHGIDLVLLAGDLFDSASPFRETGEQLAAALGQMRARVFISPGNHDWYGPGSPWETVDWPENVHIFREPRMAALELPELTFPVLGLLAGPPDQEPGQKPRMPLSVLTAKNTYPRVESYTQTLADYDREVTEYYDLRSGSRLESFTHLVATNIGVGGAHVSPIMEVLHEQGLCLR